MHTVCSLQCLARLNIQYLLVTVIVVSEKISVLTLISSSNWKIWLNSEKSIKKHAQKGSHQQLFIWSPVPSVGTCVGILDGQTEVLTSGLGYFEWSSWTGFLFSFCGFLYSCDNLSHFLVFLWAIPLFILSKRNIALCSLNCVGIIKGQSFLSYSPGFRNAYWQNLLRGKSQCSRKPLFLPRSPRPMTQHSAYPPGWHELSQPVGAGHGEDILS